MAATLAVSGPLTVRNVRVRTHRRKTVVPVRATALDSDAPPQSSINVVRTCTFTCTVGKEAEAHELCKKYVKLAQNQMKAGGSEILAFEAYVDSHDANVFHSWERYNTIQSMTAFVSSSEALNFNNEVRELLESPVQMAMFDWQDGRLGMSRLPFGPTGEGGRDDATGASGMTGGAGLQQHVKIDLGKVRRGDEGDAFNMDMPSQQNNVVKKFDATEEEESGTVIDQMAAKMDHMQQMMNAQAEEVQAKISAQAEQMQAQVDEAADKLKVALGMKKK